MKTMAEVIMLHSPIGRDENGQYCKACNHRYGYAADRQLHQQASAHIAEELSAAGFGPVQEAKAQALRDAAEAIRSERPELGPHINVSEYRMGRHDGLTTPAALCDRLAAS